MHVSPLPHQYILGSVSTFKYDDLSALKHLCTGPPIPTTTSFVQFKDLGKITFLHLEHLCVPSTTPKKCQKIHQNRLTLAIQPFRRLHQEPSMDLKVSPNYCWLLPLWSDCACKTIEVFINKTSDISENSVQKFSIQVS